jgi:small subunit ribosomal protein S12
MRHLKRSILEGESIFKRRRKLFFNPQKRGTVYRARIVTPKKPNSAKRAAAKIFLVNRLEVVSHIPGQGHNLRRFSKVLIRGGGARDLPGVYHTCVRGVYDLMGVTHKTKRRSIYGVEQKLAQKKKLRRRFRNL